jgi:D-alanyl-D-alanine carboxypeptidase/D-alanyl-D-alanine-endopeptidase (penicillin-binding protein 4)
MTPGRLRLLSIVLVLAAGAATAAEPPLQGTARRLLGADQGALAVGEDGAVLAALRADRPVHPASVTKIASTLALVRTLGPRHRFETRFLAPGPQRGATVEGDLVVEAEGDPFLVVENAFLVLLELHRQGVTRVAGRLVVRGPLLFNWQPDPSGTKLARALAGLGGASAWEALVAVRPDAARTTLRDVAITFGRGGTDGVAPTAPHLLLVHRSAPLHVIVKALNAYSNNVFHPFSARIGGPAAVERVARASVPDTVRSAVVIDNAAGAGKTNRLSPRAAVALIRVLADELHAHGLALTDVLPVVGTDPGTLRDRLRRHPARGAVVGKTGTFGSLGVSALAGVARTRRWGDVAFAVLNCGLAVPEAQRRQDAFVEALLDAGEARPWPYRRPEHPVLADATVVVDAEPAAADPRR